MKHISILIILLACQLAVRGQTATTYSCDCRTDTLFHEDFGTGPGTANYYVVGYVFTPGASTAYSEARTYTQNASPPASIGIQDGYYLVANGDNANMFGAWMKPCYDHTRGDRSGMYMIINGDSKLIKMYGLTFSGLVPGEKLFFSFFVASMINAANAGGKSKPHIILYVRDPYDSHIIKFADTGEVPNDQKWHEEGIPITVPEGYTSLIFEFINQQLDTNGNDLGIDDIMVRACKRNFLPVNPNIRGNFVEPEGN